MVCYSLRARFRLDRFILLPSVGENPNFCRFWTSAFSVVANWQQSYKVERGCTTTNLSLSNGIKIVSVFQRLTFSDVQTRDEQTDRQTDKKTQRFWPLPAAGEIRAPPNLAW